MFRFEGQQDSTFAMVEARGNLETMRQQKYKSTSSFYEKFKASVESYEHYEGGIGYGLGLLKLFRKDTDPDNPGDIPVNGAAKEYKQ